jgi:ketosteroid isomerase-like protein
MMTAALPEVSTDTLRLYFERYAGAFETFDASAIAGHYAMPCLFIRGGQTDICASADALHVSVEALLDLHKTWDVRRAKLKALHVLETAPDHLIVRADWRLGRKGRIRWAYSTTYVLVPASEGDWRIASALTHDAPF